MGPAAAFLKIQAGTPHQKQEKDEVKISSGGGLQGDKDACSLHKPGKTKIQTTSDSTGIMKNPVPFHGLSRFNPSQIRL